MACIQHVHVFLFLLAFLKLQFAEGRQLKAMKEHELSLVKHAETGLQIHAKQAIKVAKILANHKDNLQVNGHKKVLPPSTPTQRQEFSISNVSAKDVFQPMTSGNSPGVGHSFAGQKHNMQPKVQDFTSVAGKTEGFQPTTPGHSPGVGHVFGPNA